MTIMGASLQIDMSAKRLAFAHWFGITGAQAMILCLLFNARGDYLTTEQLAVLAGANADTIMVRVVRLRQAMECEAIDSERGSGYRLTEIGMAECDTAMEKFRESLGS